MKWFFIQLFLPSCILLYSEHIVWGVRLQKEIDSSIQTGRLSFQTQASEKLKRLGQNQVQDVSSLLTITSSQTNTTDISEQLKMAIKMAELRPACDDVIHTYSTATAHEGITGKAWLECFKSLTATAIKPLHKDSDKDALAAIQSLSYSLEHSHALNLNTLHQLVTCAVDENGNTIIMKLIQRGFIRTIQNSVLWSIFNPSEYSQNIFVVDKDGNNFLHLAVMSRSSSVVHSVIFALEKELSIEDIRLYFDLPNKDGKKAIDLARRSGMPPDIYSVLLDFYRAYFFGGGAKRNREVIKEPPSTPSLVTMD